MIIIGERVNATRKVIKAAVQSHDEQPIIDEIRRQDEAGANFIDLNAGTGSGDREQEASDLAWLIDIALRTTEKDFTLDSSDPAVLERDFAHLDGRRPALLNSVNGESERLEPVMGLVAKLGCPVIALAMDDSGIPPTMNDRLGVCESIMKVADKHGVSEDRIYFDPLVLPLISDTESAQITFDTIREIKSRFPSAKTTLGLSNVSHGLPQRAMINQAFLLSAIISGLDSVICDPANERIKWAITLGELVAGRDKHCRRYARRVRKGELA